MTNIQALAAARTALASAPAKDKAKAQAVVDAALAAAVASVEGVTNADVPTGAGGVWNNGMPLDTYTDTYVDGKIVTFMGQDGTIKGRILEDSKGDQVKFYNAFLNAFPAELREELTDADVNTVLFQDFQFGIKAESQKGSTYKTHVFVAE